MPILTIEAIRKNPWRILTHRLPAHPELLLLEVAYLAALYCRQSESVLMLAARNGEYTPLGWQPGEDDVHEENEAYAFDADLKLMQICEICEKEFGVVLER